MQKKVVGILAGVAAAHAVLLVSLMVGGGCRQHTILGTHTYNEGPELSRMPAAADAPAVAKPVEMPKIEGGESEVVLPPPVAQTPVAPAIEPPVAQPEKTVKAGSTTYKVKRGDTLSLIAYKHGVRTRDLAACNNLSGKAMNLIRVGQVLTIPEGGVYNESRVPKPKKRPADKPAVKGQKKVAELPADGIYVVKAGDSLDRIGRRYGVRASAIAKENNIALTKILQIGDKLRIPGKAAAVAADKPVVAPAVNNAPETANIAVDDLDPNMGLDSAASTVPEAAPALPAADTAAPAADTAKPAVPEAANEAKTESIEVPNDMTLEEYSKSIMVDVQVLRRLNPSIPADGKLKGGTYLVIPSI